MSIAQARYTNGGLTSPSRHNVPPRPPALIALQAECFYGLEEPNGFRYDDGPPVLARYLRCRAILPVEIPLQNASRVIATFKCLRRVDALGRSGSTSSSAIETVFSKFTRVWPLQGISSPENSPPMTSEPSTALVVHNTNSALDFKVEIPAHLPQSISLPGGAIYYTLQIQANLRSPPPGFQAGAAGMVIYSAEFRVDVPPPDAAYSANRLPKRITNGVVGQAQDHYGILIAPDISLHVSVPKEISYSRRTHSVFKIHLKLMPHPPEAKLPAIQKLDWKLTQRTNLGAIGSRRESNPPSMSDTRTRLAATSMELATGSIVMPTGQDAVSDVLSAAGRKDHYLYIAMPENSTVLLPMYEGNPLLEILHQLEIDLYILPVGEAGNRETSQGAESNGSPKKRKTSRWSAFFGGGGGGSSSRRQKNNHAGPVPPKDGRYHAEIPIRLFFDLSELSSTSASLMGASRNGKAPAHQRLALRADSHHSFASP